ncbi:MAG: hypothetical protein LBH98_03735 [Chitinispirillales bacterium]|jgi:hypothetical protein|nr:hypothetical protein [Chitinispirillales bacterium]
MEICRFLSLFVLFFVVRSYALSQEELDSAINHENMRIADINAIRQKYAPDTSALVKIFLNDAPFMIKKLNEIKVSDKILNDYVSRLVQERAEDKERIDKLLDERISSVEIGGKKYNTPDSCLNWLISEINNARIPEIEPNFLRDSLKADMERYVSKFINEGKELGIEIQNLCDELLGGNFKNLKKMINFTLDYNKFASGSVVLRDSLSACLMVSFLPLDPISVIDILYYTAEYKALYNNSNKIIGLINRHSFSRRNEEEEHIKAFEKKIYPIDNHLDSIAASLKILLSNKQERMKLGKDTAFVNKYVGNRLYLRALLGDTQSENKLIESYKNDTTFIGRREKLRELVFVNSPKAIKTVVESFNDEIYNKRSCSTSIRVPIINELSRIYQDDKNLRKLTDVECFLPLGATYPFRAPRYFSLRTGMEPSWTADYVKSILNWIKKEFNIIPNGGNKSLRLQKNDMGCGIGIET